MPQHSSARVLHHTTVQRSKGVQIFGRSTHQMVIHSEESALVWRLLGALVGMAKTVLSKMVGRSKVTLVELQTAVCEIEAVLIDRKLTRIPTDVNEIEPLTPSHLLYGQRITIIPYDATAEEEMDDPSYRKTPSVLSKSFLRNKKSKNRSFDNGIKFIFRLFAIIIKKPLDL